MDLSKELIIGLGFKEVEVNEYNMYKYCDNRIEEFYLEKAHKEKEFYIIYKKDKDDNMIQCGHCSDLAGLFETMMRITQIASLQLGKELKQQEIKSVLGL
jgi:hypothetical protein